MIATFQLQSFDDNIKMNKAGRGVLYVVKMAFNDQQKASMGQVPKAFEQHLFAHKIGYTEGCVKKRVSSLETGTPFGLEIVHSIPCHNARQVEATWHQTFQEHRLAGEWFDLLPESIDFIRDRTTLFDQIGKFDDEELDDRFKSIQTKNDVQKLSPASKTFETKEVEDEAVVVGSYEHGRKVQAILRRSEKEIQDRSMTRHYIEKDDNDFELIHSALEWHPKSASKIGVGVESFFVQGAEVNGIRSYCFHVKRIDGTEEDFSYRYCFPHLKRQKKSSQKHYTHSV